MRLIAIPIEQPFPELNELDPDLKLPLLLMKFKLLLLAQRLVYLDMIARYVLIHFYMIVISD